MRAGVKHVLAISTDKCCHAANAYGATKYMMEKAAQEYSRIEGLDTQFHLVRYGNVLESTGSVIEMWKNAVNEGQPIKITDPKMTRFWLSPRQAVEYVIQALELRNGIVYIPKMPALSIGRLADYTVGTRFFDKNEGETWGFESIPLRPGEKMHETLLTLEELQHAADFDNGYFTLRPSTEPVAPEDMRPKLPYTSDMAPELTKAELVELLND
jgi:UDP-N-acetylglucosamine 4,6-dehydratase/5-epimerase